MKRRHGINHHQYCRCNTYGVIVLFLPLYGVIIHLSFMQPIVVSLSIPPLYQNQELLCRFPAVRRRYSIHTVRRRRSCLYHDAANNDAIDRNQRRTKNSIVVSPFESNNKINTDNLKERTMERNNDWQYNWGVQYHNQHDYKHRINDRNIVPYLDDFPTNINEVTTMAAAAIASVLYQNHTHIDPNIIENTVHGSHYVMKRRSVRHVSYDIGRMGIEFDFSTKRKQYETNSNNYSAIRTASLILAGKLSQSSTYAPYITTEEQSGGNNNSNNHHSNMLRPITIYYNTIQQALAASELLRHLKHSEKMQQQQRNADFIESRIYDNTNGRSIYDSIYIRCLGQGDTIPNEIIDWSHQQRMDTDNDVSRRFTKSKRHKSHSLATGEIDPAGGLILIVQPTDYNDEYHPSGPSIGTIHSLQRLVANAAIHQIPTILISPRFLHVESQLSYSSVTASTSGWDQSGYHQQSSIYAGLEPPKGPTPWILRDFTPPIFCYVSNVLAVHDDDDDDRRLQPRISHVDSRYRTYSHLSLLQSILQKGHMWNIYAAYYNTCDQNNQHDNIELQYDCVASTSNVAGRPPRELIRKIWNEYNKQ